MLVLVVGICQKTSAQGWAFVICRSWWWGGDLSENLCPGVGHLSENLCPGVGHLSILLEAVNAIPFSILNSLKNRPNFIPCGDLALPDFRELIKFWIQNDFQNNYKVKQRSLHAVETILKARLLQELTILQQSMISLLL